MKIKSKYYILLVIFAPLIFYLKLFKGFFQQDEWYGYAWYILHKDLSFWQTTSFFFAPSIGHYNPLSIGTVHMLFSIWGLNYQNFLVLSILLHALITLCVFYLAKIIFKGRLSLAILTALLFSLFAASYQATGWVVANIATQSATLLGVISAILFFKFLEKENRKYFVSAMVLLVVSLLFKEITIGLLPLFLGVYVLFNKKRKLNKKVIFWIVLVGILYVLFRVSMLFAPNTTGDQIITQSQDFSKIVYNFVTVPFKALSQTVFPSDFIKLVSTEIARIFPEKIAGTYGSPQFEYFVVKRVMEAVSLVSFGIIMFIAIFTVRKNKEYSKIALLSLGWIIINALIFSFAPEYSGTIFVVDSRNLYFISIGVALLIVLAIKVLSNKSHKKLLLLFSAILFLNIFWLNKNLTEYIQRGETRKYILNQISAKYGDLPGRVVFYTESDISYYGLAESDKILPFQSGFGQTLLAWYYKDELFPKEFFENKFLWEIRSQGYKEVDGRGFGYFRDLNLLVHVVNENKISKESIIAFRWRSKEGVLTNITDEVIKKLYDKKIK